MRWTTLREWKTAKCRVTLAWTYDDDYENDVQDENGDPCQETAEKLESGEWTAYGFKVTVWIGGQVAGEDSLWGSIYPDPAEALKQGISGYLPQMVSAAVNEARRFRADLPQLRAPR